MDKNENNVQNNVNQNVKEMHEPKEKKSNGNKAKGFVVFVFLVLFLGAGFGLGYLFAGKWDPFKGNNNTTNTTTNNATETKSGKKIDESRPWVYDMKIEEKEFEFEYEGGKDTYKASETFKVPYININSEDAKKVNEEILSVYNNAIQNFGKIPSEGARTISGIEYNAYENGKYLSVVLTESFGYVHGSGSKVGEYAYTFNLDTLKLVTFKEAYTDKGYEEKNIEERINKFVERAKKDISGGPQDNNSTIYFNHDFYIDGQGKIKILIANKHTEWNKTVLTYVTYDLDDTIINQNDTSLNQTTSNNTNTTTNKADSESFPGLVKFAGKAYENQDYDATTANVKEYCEVSFDNIGSPYIKIGDKSAESTECSFYTKEISNCKSEGAAGTTYVTFDFTAWTAGGDTTGNATISFSNVSENDYSITVSAKVKYNDGEKEYNNIKVKPVGQTASESFTLEDFKNRVYESEKKENNFWYKVEFDEKGNPTITEGYLAGGVSQIVDTYKRFTDVSAEGAAGSVYVTFSYRLLNETGDKVEGRLKYSNNTDNKEIYLKMYNKDNTDNEVMLKQIK